MTFARPADACMGNYFRTNRQMGQRDRALIADAVYNVLRHKRWLEMLCDGPSAHRMLLACMMKFGGQSLIGAEPFASGREMEWLEQVRSARTDDLPPAVRLDLPDWVFDRLSTQYSGTDLESLGRSLQNAAPLDLRVNTLKAEREQVISRLRDEGWPCEPTPHSPVGIRLEGKPAINFHPLFVDGSIEVQDEGSQLLALLLAPRRQDMVVDFCAGAGGKTLALGALMHSQGRLYAFDVSDKRLARFQPRLKRSGLSNVFPKRITGERDAHVKRLAGKVDRVLVDAPCTGLGTIRRNPDLKWRQQEADVAQMSSKQSDILASAATLLKPGGQLVYATCSLLKEENESVVENFLGANPGYRAVNADEALAQARIPLSTGPYLKLRPDLHGTDGFFAAIIERAPSA